MEMPKNDFRLQAIYPKRTRRNNLIQPFVKWVGGKRQILDEIKEFMPLKYSKYYEPFLGGGALLFDIQPRNATVSDINKELINLYLVIKNDVNSLINDLKKHKNDSNYYYQMRELDRNKEAYSKLSSIEKASRIIFLNKTCYNGLFRVNKAGEFNSPFGSYEEPNIVNEPVLKAVNYYFIHSKIDIQCCDFEAAVSSAKAGDFVYFDPPYDPVSSSASFTGYDKGGFSRKEQTRLKLLCDKLNRAGVKFLLSNSATDFIKDIYQAYRIKPIMAKRVINSKATMRGDVEEVLIRNYEE